MRLQRRNFITLLGGAAAGWPAAARAQQRNMPVIGYLSGGTQAANVDTAASFRRGLGEGGYVEGRNIAIEYRWADNNNDRLPALADDLVRHRVAAIFATGQIAPRVAKAATPTIPIVFQMGEDPVKEGIVASLNRPGGNITGFSNFSNVLFSKRLGLLRDIAPRAEAFAFLVNPNNPNAEPDTKEVQAAAAAAGRPAAGSAERRQRARIGDGLRCHGSKAGRRGDHWSRSTFFPDGARSNRRAGNPPRDSRDLQSS